MMEGNFEFSSSSLLLLRFFVFFFFSFFVLSSRMFKVKTEWYFARSKKDKQDFSFNSEANIWKYETNKQKSYLSNFKCLFLSINRYVLEEQLDDALAFMNDQRLRERARDFGAALWERVGALQVSFLKSKTFEFFCSHLW
jgi:hypothetical protein